MKILHDNSLESVVGGAVLGGGNSIISFDGTNTFQNMTAVPANPNSYGGYPDPSAIGLQENGQTLDQAVGLQKML